MKREMRMIALSAFLLVTAGILLVGCGVDGIGSTVLSPQVASILNTNNSTEPSNPLSLPIEIKGSGFQAAPGQVIFTQSAISITATVVTNASGWSASGNTPGGNHYHLMTGVNLTTGSAGTRTQLSSTLPEPPIGPASAPFSINIGYTYVIGGLRPDGVASQNV